MKAITLENTVDKYIISIDKNALDENTTFQIIEQTRIEQLAQKIDFGEDIEALGEEIKAKWWQKNKARLLNGEEKK
jgi:hypothetical protein